MSHSKVITSLEGRIEAFLNTLTPKVKYYSSINKQTKPTEQIWVTSYFYAYNNEITCYSGIEFIEKGACEVSVFSRAGKGYLPARELAEKIQDFFRAEKTATRIEVFHVTPSSEGSNGDATRWYEVTFSLEYNYVN